MESSTVISTDKATVVIEVNPQVTQDTVVFVDGHEAGGKNHNMTFQGFFKAQPKTLGTVQIMIGVMVFLLGILLTANLYISQASPVNIGITYWGSFIYITAGSLSVAAEKKLSPCMVKASLGMNVVSAVTAGLAILLMSIQLAISIYYPGLNAERLRIIGILLVFAIPQFIISICISAFACKAACNKNSTVVNVALNQGY